MAAWGSLLILSALVGCSHSQLWNSAAVSGLFVNNDNLILTTSHHGHWQQLQQHLEHEGFPITLETVPDFMPINPAVVEYKSANGSTVELSSSAAARQQHLAQGGSAVIRCELDTRHDAVFEEQLQQEANPLADTGSLHLYLSGPNGRALTAHTDKYDAVIAQVRGATLLWYTRSTHPVFSLV